VKWGFGFSLAKHDVVCCGRRISKMAEGGPLGLLVFATILALIGVLAFSIRLFSVSFSDLALPASHNYLLARSSSVQPTMRALVCILRSSAFADYCARRASSMSLVFIILKLLD